MTSSAEPSRWNEAPSVAWSADTKVMRSMLSSFANDGALVGKKRRLGVRLERYWAHAIQELHEAQVGSGNGRLEVHLLRILYG